MRVMTLKNTAWSLLCLSLLAPAASVAQTVPPPAPAAATEPAPPQPPAPAASAPPADPKTQRIEITGGRASDNEQRRQSTAAKIVIGRDEIERFGDSNLLDLMKRLPGVTVPGAPGRGGNPRMRGMGGNYTQILIDGERMAPGFSLDSIPPEQIERIEILRAPTAETGARAIAGTINIVLREGFKKRMNDVRIGAQWESSKWSPGLSWTRNDSLGPLIYNVSLSLFEFRQNNANESETIETELGTGAVLLSRNGTFESQNLRRGLHATARLQWRNEAGTSVMVQPVIVSNRGNWQGNSTLNQPFAIDGSNAEYARSAQRNEGRFQMARLNANVNHRLGDSGPRLEWRLGLGEGRWRGNDQRLEFDRDGLLTRTIDETTRSSDRSASLSLKAVASLDGGHNLVAGAEVEAADRDDEKVTLWDGVAQLTDFEANLQSSTRRMAIYAQDEWAISPQWAVHAGLRSEQINTVGEGANAVQTRNTNRVTTPLLHAVYKFDEKSKDQVRASVTRSYRSPNTGQLIGRPTLNRVNPAPGSNTETTADSAGNPSLKPEIAAGLDVAFERYLDGGGVLSANVFHRRISSVIRNTVSLEDVSWSPGVPRYVSRPQNIGNATTQGIELEAKFRMDQLVADAPRTDLRLNLSLFRSRIDSIPGPDNRITEQPNRTLNLGIDHRFRGTPWAVGSSWNHTPGYRTQLEADRAIVANEKNAVDAYATYTFNPNALLRLSLGNVLAADTSTDTTVFQTNPTTGTASRTDVATDGRSYRSARIGLELKL
jgi:outer membrane receptor for ferrienterochelin and colicins